MNSASSLKKINFSVGKHNSIYIMKTCLIAIFCFTLRFKFFPYRVSAHISSISDNSPNIVNDNSKSTEKIKKHIKYTIENSNKSYQSSLADASTTNNASIEFSNNNEINNNNSLTKNEKENIYRLPSSFLNFNYLKSFLNINPTNTYTYTQRNPIANSFFLSNYLNYLKNLQNTSNFLPKSPISSGAKISNWDYKTQGDDWNKFCLCGNRQSPINIVHNNTQPGTVLQNLFINFLKNDPTYYSVNNNHHSLQYEAVNNPTDGKFISGGFGYVEFNGTKYEVQQFHFHSPAEHTFNVNFIRHDLELHIVCKHTDTDLLVVGITFVEDNTASQVPFLKGILSTPNFPPSPGEKQIISSSTSQQLLLSSLFQAETDEPFYSYLGSLTTPPCSEIVTWHLKSNPIPTPLDQLKFFKNFFKYPGTLGNYRNIQNLPEYNKNNQVIYRTTGHHI